MRRSGKSTVLKIFQERLVRGGINPDNIIDINLERVDDAIFVRDDVDLYITGSSAFFLSGELATLLTGRYVDFHMLLFSFAEYRSAFPEVPAEDLQGSRDFWSQSLDRHRGRLH